MNLAELHRKLIAVARANPPGDHVPYAFEKRILAHLRSLPAVDNVALWARALWRAATPCVIIMLLFSMWSFLSPNGNASLVDFSQEFENTVLAAVDQEQVVDSW